MHAADPAGGEEANPGRAADGKRAADGRGTHGPLNRRCGEVAWADLPRRLVEPLQLELAETDNDLAVEHADRRRHRLGVAERLLRGEPDLDALARREPVRDERRLEPDDRGACDLCLADLVGDPDHGIAPSFSQQRAAASSPRATPPTR